VGRSPNAARLLASRARHRVQAAVPLPDVDPARQQEVVSAFFAASRDGDFDALVTLLDPDVVVHADWGVLPVGVPTEVRGARAVAEQALTFSRLAWFARPALVNGAAGAIVARRGRPLTVIGFTIRNGTIAEIDILADPARLRHLDLAELSD
jgi:RNA polymerase sigma-70 factor (ECF subfamily)